MPLTVRVLPLMAVISPLKLVILGIMLIVVAWNSLLCRVRKSLLVKAVTRSPTFKSWIEGWEGAVSAEEEKRRLILVFGVTMTL